MSGEQVQDAQLTAASALIDQAIAVNPVHEAATALRGEVLALRRQRERDRDDARHVRAVLARARENLELEEFDACIAGCDDALTVSSGSAEARELRQRAVAARDERRRNREIRQRAEKAVREARAEFAAGNRDAALARLGRFQPPHELVQQAIEELRGVLPPASIAATTPIAAPTVAAARVELPPTPPAAPTAAQPSPIPDHAVAAPQPAADVRRSSRAPVVAAAAVAVLDLRVWARGHCLADPATRDRPHTMVPSSRQSSSPSPPAPQAGVPARTTDSATAPASAANPPSPAASAPPSTENSTPPTPVASTPASTVPPSDPAAAAKAESAADAGPAGAGSEPATRRLGTSGGPAASKPTGQPQQADAGTAKKGDRRGGHAVQGGICGGAHNAGRITKGHSSSTSSVGKTFCREANRRSARRQAAGTGSHERGNDDQGLSGDRDQGADATQAGCARLSESGPGRRRAGGCRCSKPPSVRTARFATSRCSSRYRSSTRRRSTPSSNGSTRRAPGTALPLLLKSRSQSRSRCRHPAPAGLCSVDATSTS